MLFILVIGVIAVIAIAVFLAKSTDADSFDSSKSTISGKTSTSSPTAIQQLSKDVGMLPINGFNCPKCGAVVKIDPNHPAAFCQFCGAPFPKSEELFKLSYEYLEKNKQRQMEEQRMKHESRITTMKTISQNGRWIAMVVYLIVVLIICLMIFVPILLK